MVLVNLLRSWLRLPASIVSRSRVRSLCSVNLVYNYSTIMPSENPQKAVVLLAKGAEEMELVITVDVLRRAGIAVTVAGLNGTDPVKCSRDVIVVPDQSLSDAVKNGPYDVVVLPGGLEGAKNLASSSAVGELLKEQEKAGRLIAAICAAPTALKAHNIGLGKDITSYPSFDKELSNDYKYKQDKFVKSGNIITSRGPGTAFDFGLFIAETLTDKETAGKVAKGMLLDTDYAKQLQ